MPISPTQLRALLAAARRGSTADFHNTATALAKQLNRYAAPKADQLLGEALNSLVATEKAIEGLDGTGDGSGLFGSEPQLPTRSGALPAVQPKVGFADLRLPRSLGDVLEGILLELEHPEEFRKHALQPTKAILLYGHSGTGKTSIAHAIAKESNRPLYVMLASDLESKFMGETARNLASGFRAASYSPCVLLLDECDTLLHRRGLNSSSTAREEASITNTLLQQLDAMHPNILLIATTNLLKIVDSAALRRFDHVLEIPLPSEKAIKRRAIELADKHDLEIELVDSLDLGPSYATCEIAVRAEVRRLIAKRLGAL